MDDHRNHNSGSIHKPNPVHKLDPECRQVLLLLDNVPSQPETH